MLNVNDWSDWDRKHVGSYLQWNSYLSERHRIFYVATPKVACTTIKWWFAEIEGVARLILEGSTSAESDPDLSIHDTFHRVAPLVTGVELKGLTLALSSAEYFRFAVVRNPYKRIFSAWQSKLLLREPLQVAPYIYSDFYNYPINSKLDISKAFEMFLEHLLKNEAPAFWDIHWGMQADLLRPDLIDYSLIVRIEESQILTERLRDRLGESFPGPLDHHHSNESLIPFVPEFITERSAELIRTLYKHDFDVFEYDTKVPSVKTQFSDQQFEVAIKAVNFIRARHQRLGERNRQIASLNQAMGERDGQIASLNQAVGERDGQIASLNQAVGERDGQISNLVKTVEEIYRSYGWRALAPLRYFGGLRQRIDLFFRALSLAMNKAGGGLALLRYMLRVWRQDGLAGILFLARQQIAHQPAITEAPASGQRGDYIVSNSMAEAVDEPVAKESGPEILFVSHDASRTGAPIFLLNVARELKNELGLGCAFLLCSGGELEEQFRALGSTWVLSSRHELPPLTLSAFQKRDIRLVYSNTATNGLIQQRLKKLGCPIICHVHELGYSIEQHFGGVNLKALLATTDYFLAGSGVVSDYIIGHLRIPAEKVTIAHPFVDVAANLRAVEHCQRPLDLPDGAVVIGACGTVGWRKGTDVFIHVARRALELTKRPIHFVWIGGPLGYGDFAGIQYDMSVLGIADRISFTGSVVSHLPYLAQFDIFALPSREDPFPLVALDAASLGLPVVCFADAGGAPELVEGDGGLVVPYLDVDRMAEAIVKLVEDEGLRQRLGSTAKAKVETRHDIGVGGRHIADIVESYIKSSAKEEM